MNGTNRGEFAGLPPTQRPVSLPGLDVVETAPDGITSVTGYFDSKLVPELCTCGKTIDYEKNTGRCACGTLPPEAPAYF